MDKFIRPETLFGNKFESYLNSDKSHSSGHPNTVNLGKKSQSYEDITKPGWKYGQ